MCELVHILRHVFYIIRRMIAFQTFYYISGYETSRCHVRVDEVRSYTDYTIIAVNMYDTMHTVVRYVLNFTFVPPGFKLYIAVMFVHVIGLLKRTICISTCRDNYLWYMYDVSF